MLGDQASSSQAARWVHLSYRLWLEHKKGPVSWYSEKARADYIVNRERGMHENSREVEFLRACLKENILGEKFRTSPKNTVLRKLRAIIKLSVFQLVFTHKREKTNSSTLVDPGLWFWWVADILLSTPSKIQTNRILNLTSVRPSNRVFLTQFLGTNEALNKKKIIFIHSRFEKLVLHSLRQRLTNMQLGGPLIHVWSW